MTAQPAKAPGALRSRLYTCRVMHHRLKPKTYRFEHEIFLFCFDLDEIDRITSQNPLLSRNRPGFYSFYDRDHLPLCGSGDVKTNLSAFMARKGYALPDDARIELLTSTRMLGYVFNPVSFYFITLSDGQPLCAVAEVSNTFREMKAFVVPPDKSASGANPVFRLCTQKNFYVSPFFDVEDEFEFRLTSPRESLNLRVNTLVEGETALVATVQGNPLPLTARNLIVQTLRVPFVTLKIIIWIHLHGAILTLKRIGLNWKHQKPDQQTELFNPHRTIRRRP